MSSSSSSRLKTDELGSASTVSSFALLSSAEKQRELRQVRTRLKYDDSSDRRVKIYTSDRWRPCVALCLLMLYGTSLFLCYQSFVRLPEPNDSRTGWFMESSAMNVTRELAASIGHRYVSTMNEERSAQYLEAALRGLAESDSVRSDVTVQVVREQVIGSNGLQEAFGFQIANVYNNLTNIVMVVTPKDGVSRVKSVLVNAHYDSTLGSPGASDCASCVGVGFEVARTILMNSSIPLYSPLVFLFNGGEETLMQAAHGFMATSAFASQVGAFINIESTGPWGPDVIFQHTDDWTLSAFAKVAPYPRGNSVAQDFFEMGLIPADTDYRMLRGISEDARVPGVDLAFLFDGLAYHTREDTVERIRSGTLQSMGENVLSLVSEYSKVLGVPGYEDEVYSRASGRKGVQGQVFFDIGGMLMVVYSAQVASVLHSLPLMVLLLLSLTTVISEPSVMMGHVRTAMSSVGLCILLPCILGGVRALLSGHPISWYGNFLESALVFLPLASAGILLPCDGLREQRTKDSLGFGVLFAMLGSLTMMLGMTSSFVTASWGAGTIIATVLQSKLSHLGLMLGYLLPSYFGCSIAITTLVHVIEKIGITGSMGGIVGIFLTDSVVGALSGLCVVLVFGSLTPHVAYALGAYKKRLCMILAAISIASAILSSYMSFEKSPRVKKGIPYTHVAPKRMIFQHIHKIAEYDDSIESSMFSACSLDAIEIDEDVMLPWKLKSLPNIPFDSHDWVSLYPLNFLVTGISKEDNIKEYDEIQEIWPRFPSLKKSSFFSVAVDSIKHYLNDGYEAMRLAWSQASLSPKVQSLKRKHFELDTVFPGWAVLNITGDIVQWSLGEHVASVDSTNAQHIVRYASGPYTTVWRFWIDVPKENSDVTITMYVKHFKLAPYAEDILHGIKSWISPATVTTWQRTYHL